MHKTILAINILLKKNSINSKNKEEEIQSISLLLKSNNIRVWSIKNNNNEKEILERLFIGIEKIKPVLITYNGIKKYLPILNMKCIKYGIICEYYWKNIASYSANNIFLEIKKNICPHIDIASFYDNTINNSMPFDDEKIGVIYIYKYFLKILLTMNLITIDQYKFRKNELIELNNSILKLNS